MEAEAKTIKVFEMDMPSTIKGLYSDNIVWINKNIPTRTEKACTLAEEIEHQQYSTGDILAQNDISNLKQEKYARSKAYEKLIPPSAFIAAHRLGIQNRHELAEHLGVTEEFLDNAIKRYQEKYGLGISLGFYTIIFEPLGVLEMFDFT
ncbi:ImmA/IrrE family metallo-endopeptidase [Paenibacillus ehimensis]|uniref:ImmA/IrrE family metallo-endopeptidase n=1 Tax=Paenibacillus ehimensis TaxID=79264 RepID=UPI0034E2A3E9